MKSKNQNPKTENKTNSGLLNRTAQLDDLKRLDWRLRIQNRGLSAEALLERIKAEAMPFWTVAEVVGKWVWVQFEEKQPREVTFVLAQLGFHWNGKRQVWQHPCGTLAEERATYDPRKRYGSYFAASKVQAGN